MTGAPDPARLRPLAECPQVLPLLADWFYRQWRRPGTDLSPERIGRRLQERLTPGRLPQTWVYFVERQPVASVSLVLHEMDVRPQYPHWLGSLYVLPAWRGRGLGSWLVQAAERLAGEFGLPRLYLYTHDQAAFFARLGWRTLERLAYHGRTVALMQRYLLETTRRQ